MSSPSELGVIATIMSRDCSKHIAWLKAAFGAEQKEIYYASDKKHVMHCLMVINKGRLFLCDSVTSLEERSLSEEERESESRGLVLHVELEEPNVFWKNALANGATVIEDLKKQYWGAVYGKLQDPFGFVWGLMKGGECRKPGVIPYLTVNCCEEYLVWAEKALGGVVKDKFMSDKNKIQHCTLEVNGGVLYLADNPSDTEGVVQPHVVLHRSVDNPTKYWDQLKTHGASTVVNLEMQFWGDLYGTAKDEQGFSWSLCKLSDKSSDVKSTKDTGVVPYINSPNCKKHVEWIEAVFGGKVDVMNKVESGEVIHCQMTVNGGMLMLSDRFDMTQPDKPSPVIPEEHPSKEESEKNGSRFKCGMKGVTLHLSMDDPDNIWKRAMEKEAVEIVPLKKQHWGDYFGQFQDPLGYCWSICKN